MKTRLLVAAVAVCMTATPAMAAMFDFTYGSINSQYTYATGAFVASADKVYPATGGTVERFVAPVGVAQFSALSSWPGPEDVSLTMTITNIDNVGLTADGINGLLTLTDTGGDTITANVAGTWSDIGASNYFAGTLSNVRFTDVGTPDGNFDGHAGSVSMSFATPEPWSGSILELSTTGTWFGEGIDYTSQSGSLEGSILPAPAAVVLGVLGLAVVGWKLRKFA